MPGEKRPGPLSKKSETGEFFMVMDSILNELERRNFFLEIALVNLKSNPIRDEVKIAILEKRRLSLMDQILKKQDELQQQDDLRRRA